MASVPCNAVKRLERHAAAGSRWEGGSQCCQAMLPALPRALPPCHTPCHKWLSLASRGCGGTSLDLQALVVRRPAATFFLRMRGDAMQRAGVFAGDILVVDRSLRPTARRLIVLAVAGELLVRRYIRAASHYGVIFVAGGDDASSPSPSAMEALRAMASAMTPHQAVVWGVVTYVIHRADTLPDAGPDGSDGAADAGADCYADRYADVPDVG